MGKKLQLKTVALVWAESIKWSVKTPLIVHGRVRDDVKKKNVNEKNRQMTTK